MTPQPDLHPAIGLLNREGSVIPYAYIDGQYYEGNVPELTAKLRLAEHEEDVARQQQNERDGQHADDLPA